MDFALRPRVAVVRDARRRAAVAQAVYLVRDELSAVVGPEPTVVGPAHADALSALLDALLAAGAGRIRLLGARRHPSILAETFGRPVAFADDAADVHDPIILATVRTRRAASGAPASRTWDRLGPGIPPRLAVVDAFDALGVAVAGTGARAVDAVLAALCGRGVVDPASIEVIGDAGASPGARRLRIDAGQPGKTRRGARHAVAARSREAATETEANEPR
jgi:hypothetical protein